ncbi:hypothetical protein D3C87_1694520 [compost metagenome]
MDAALGPDHAGLGLAEDGHLRLARAREQVVVDVLDARAQRPEDVEEATADELAARHLDDGVVDALPVTVAERRIGTVQVDVFHRANSSRGAVTGAGGKVTSW